MPAQMPETAWIKTSPEVVQLFESAVSGWPEAEKRKMFGYPCAFTRGQMFFCVFGNDLALRLSEADRAACLMAGGAIFEPMAGRPMREYVMLPSTITSAPDTLANWIGKSISYAQSLPPKEAKPKKPKTAKVAKG